MSDVGGALAAMLGGGYVNYFSISGRSYKVIPQVQQRYRLNPHQLLDYYIRTADGALVPLSTVATVATKTVPESLNHFQQLNSATIQGVAMPGVAQGDALGLPAELSARMLPQGYSIDYGGLSRQYVQETSGFVTTFGFALIIIFLALAALFESFRDPVIILVSVPMSIAGALIFITLGFGGMSLNIYTEVGLVTLMGLISKHGILIVQFANHLQQQGRTKREAIEEAAGIRLRPILMTTAAMVLGVVPLITASGAGAVSRFQMGVVIASGLVHRHAVHAVRGSRGLSGLCRGSSSRRVSRGPSGRRRSARNRRRLTSACRGLAPRLDRLFVAGVHVADVLLDFVVLRIVRRVDELAFGIWIRPQRLQMQRDGAVVRHFRGADAVDGRAGDLVARSVLRRRAQARRQACNDKNGECRGFRGRERGGAHSTAGRDQR